MWKWHYQRRRARERLRVWCQRPRAMQCQTMNKHVEQDDGRNSRCQEAEFQERHWKVPRRMFMPAAWRDSGILWLQMFLPVGYLTQTDPTRTIQSSNRSYLDKQPILGTPLVWCIFFYARPAGPELESGQTWKWTTIWAIYYPNWAICLKSGQNFSRSGQKKLFMLLVLTVLNATLGWGTSSNRSYINYNDKQQISDTAGAHRHSYLNRSPCFTSAAERQQSYGLSRWAAALERVVSAPVLWQLIVFTTD